eukprot:Gb_31822 [translate_table: standard]
MSSWKEGERCVPSAPADSVNFAWAGEGRWDVYGEGRGPDRPLFESTRLIQYISTANHVTLFLPARPSSISKYKRPKCPVGRREKGASHPHLPIALILRGQGRVGGTCMGRGVGRIDHSSKVQG